MIELRYDTPRAWVAIVESDLVAFLQDHAANEHRVSRSALSLALQHPEREALVDAMVEIAVEELDHFKQVYGLLKARGATLGQGLADPYMRSLRKQVSDPDRERWLLHRLVLFAVVERRGFERFSLLGEHLADAELAGVELAGAEPASAIHDTAGHARAEPANAGPTDATPAGAEPASTPRAPRCGERGAAASMEAASTEPTSAGLNRAEPAGAEPATAEPARADPTTAGAA